MRLGVCDESFEIRLVQFGLLNFGGDALPCRRASREVGPISCDEVFIGGGETMCL
jgi:hypothetical protein